MADHSQQTALLSPSPNTLSKKIAVVLAAVTFIMVLAGFFHFRNGVMADFERQIQDMGPLKQEMASVQSRVQTLQQTAQILHTIPQVIQNTLNMTFLNAAEDQIAIATRIVDDPGHSEQLAEILRLLDDLEKPN